jgi:hypothetical protein
MLKLRLPSVRDSIYRQFESMGAAATDVIQFLLRRDSKVGIFAGAVRDAVAAAEFGWEVSQPRDWDIGVSNISQKDFHGILAELGGIQNHYGGYKLLLNGIVPWEVWRVEDTVGLRIRNAPRTLENVLRSFVLSSNAIVFDLDEEHFYDQGVLRSIASRKIEILSDAIIHDNEVFAAKALTLSFRFPFRLGPKALTHVRRHLTETALLHELQKINSSLAIYQPKTAKAQCQTLT